MRVLLSIVTGGGTFGNSCTLGFAVSMLRQQVALAQAPNIQTVIHVASTVHEAARVAVEQGGFDAVAAVASNLAFPVAFVLRALVAPAPFVAGIYPLPTIDWDRVVAKAADATEDMQFKGNTYSIDPAAAKHSASPGYLTVNRAGLDAVVLKKQAFEALAAAGATDDLCAAWGKPIDADLDNQCSNMGPIEFTGCVGLRTVLR